VCQGPRCHDHQNSKGHDIGFLLFQIKIQTKMPAARSRKGRSGAAAAHNEEDASDTELPPAKANCKIGTKKKAKDAAPAESAAETALAEVASLVADDAAAKKKQPPPPPSPSKPAPDRSDKERTNQERIRVMEQNRKEKEEKDAQDQHAARLLRLEEQNKKLRQQLKTSKAHSSEPTTPKRRRSNSETREKKVNAIFDMWILPPTTFDGLKCTVQAKKIRAVVADNMFERFSSQTVTRPLMRFAVQLLVSRLGPRLTAASLRGLLLTIVRLNHGCRVHRCLDQWQ
jgi:hypothetical protein